MHFQACKFSGFEELVCLVSLNTLICLMKEVISAYKSDLTYILKDNYDNMNRLFLCILIISFKYPRFGQVLYCIFKSEITFANCRVSLGSLMCLTTDYNRQVRIWMIVHLEFLCYKGTITYAVLKRLNTGIPWVITFGNNFECVSALYMLIYISLYFL